MRRVVHVISIAVIVTSIFEMGVAAWHYAQLQQVEAFKRSTEERFEQLSDRVYEDEATPDEEREYEALEGEYERLEKRTRGFAETAKVQGIISFATALAGLALLSHTMGRRDL